MDSTVKAAMLKSSQALTFNPPSPPLTPRTVRKAHSSDSLASPRPPTASIAHDFPRLPDDGGFVPGSSLSNQASMSVTALNIPSHAAGSHTRGVSMDIMRTMSRGQVPPVIPTEFTSGKLIKDKALAKSISPARFCSILTSTSSTQLELETVKKLRLLLRNESARFVVEKNILLLALTCRLQLVAGILANGRLRVTLDTSQRDFGGGMAVRLRIPFYYWIII
jgi:hypothetical protein